MADQRGIANSTTLTADLSLLPRSVSPPASLPLLAGEQVCFAHRDCDGIKQVAKAVNESYKSFNANQFPTVVADFQLAPGEAQCDPLASVSES